MASHIRIRQTGDFPQTFRDIVKAALRHYPGSKHMRREYIAKTSLLISSERHVFCFPVRRKPQCA